MAQLGDYDQETVDKIAGVAGDTPAPMLMMNHDLTLSQLYVNAVVECRKYQLALEWQNSRMLELQGLGVQPDGWLKVAANPRHRVHGGVAGQAGADGQDHWLHRVAGASGGPPVLWLTISRHRLEQLRQAIARCPYEDNFLLGLIEDASEYITKRMWHWSGGPELVNWLTPSRRILFDPGGQQCRSSQPA